MFGRRLLFGIGIVLLFDCPAFAGRVEASAPTSKSKPFELLAKSLKCDCGFNVCAVIQQRDPFGSGVQRVKVDRDRKGRIHKLVLGPLTMLGVESVDDGFRWQTILPDERVVLDQESPTQDSADVNHRLRLAKKNYRFALIGDETIAGRRAIRIQAIPVWHALAVRSYALDARTLYPLKEESEQNGQERLEFVTLDISFPKVVNEEQFDLKPEMGMRVIRFERPQNVREPSEARRVLGFTPYMPKGSPMGFEPQEMQISQDGSWQALVVRLTDGLARATLYEYSASESNVRAMDQSSSREIGGVRLMVVCPLGDTVRNALLDSLEATRERLAELGWSLDIGTSPPVFGVRKSRAPMSELASWLVSSVG